jgi:hypothetical protein
VQQGDAFSFCHGSDEQAGETYRSHAPAAPERGLDIKRAPPVLIMCGEPFVAGVAVDSQLVEFRAAPGGLSQFELDDTAGGYHSRLDQRGKHRGNYRVAQAGQIYTDGCPAGPESARVALFWPRVCRPSLRRLHDSRGGIPLGEVMAMNEEQKAAALAGAVQALGLDGAVAEDVLSRLWDESFEQGRLAALDELQDRFCVCMQ